MQSLIDAINAIQEVIQEDEQWIYIAVTDNVTCNHCLQNDGKIFRRNQELDLIDIFPDMVEESPTVIYPNVHMSLWGKPTCRCKLFLSNLARLEDNQPVNPVMSEKPQTDHALPKPETPRALTYNPFELDQAEKELSDNQYKSVLDGLLSLGYLSTAVYSAILTRRDTQQMNKDEVLAYLKTVDAKDPVWLEIKKVIGQ